MFALKGANKWIKKYYLLVMLLFPLILDALNFILQVFDIDELIKPRKEAARKKMLDELREETIESAKSKITAAKQSQQLEAAEEGDECKSATKYSILCFNYIDNKMKERIISSVTQLHLQS